MIVADTDVLIDFLNGKGAAQRVADELGRGLATTVVSAFELWAGSIGSARREAAVTRLLDALDVWALEQEAAREAARVRRALQREGITLGMADSLIAGVCLVRSAALLTRNTRHFEIISGLKLA